MENHIDPSTMLEFIEGLATMAVLDQDGVYTYVSPGWERYTGHTAQEAIGRKVWEMVPDTHATEVFHTGKPVFAKAVNANGPAFTSYFPRFDRDGKLCGLFLYVIVQGMEDAQNLTRRIGELSSKVEFYQQELSRERGARYGLDNIIGESASVLRLKEQIVQAARSTSTVLIEGETGSGKELIAHSIHAMSARKAANFVRVNCSAIPAELMESEFFGYAAGAFTGAAKSGKPGMFELAHKGTLLLDEIGELPLPMQAKLLQVLDGHPFHRVGGTKPITVDVRVIAATNKPLADMAASGQFREDLFYRLRVLTVEIPPLRERPDDIPVLAMHFLQEIIKKSGLQKNFDPQVLNCFLTYRWPGNVRELRALVQSLATMSEEETITMQDLPQYMQAQSPLPQGSVSFRQPMREAVAELERNMIMTALTETGSTYKAARRLKVSQSTIVRKAQRYKIGLVEIAHK